MKHLLFFLLLLSIAGSLSGQERKRILQGTVGVASPILDNGLGIHLGVNPAFQMRKQFFAEGQVSYIYTNAQSSFLAGETSTAHTANVLLGARVYLNSPAQTTRFFLHAMFGFFCHREVNQFEADEIGLGRALGGYVEFNRLVTGLAFNSPQHLILKLGYSF